VFAVDTQLLVYAHRPTAPQQAATVEVLRRLVASPEPWAIPWPCVHEFLATITRPRYFNPPSTIRLGLDAIDRLGMSGNLHFLGEAEGHLALLAQLCDSGRAVGAIVHDARIAAICLGHGVSELLTADRDFTRFPALRMRNPLV